MSLSILPIPDKSRFLPQKNFPDLFLYKVISLFYSHWNFAKMFENVSRPINAEKTKSTKEAFTKCVSSSILFVECYPVESSGRN